LDLATNGTGGEVLSVRVCEEGGRVVDDLLKRETAGGTSVEAGGSVCEAGGEGTLKATTAAPDTIFLGERVEEGDARGTVGALGSLVDVCCALGGREVECVQAEEVNSIADLQMFDVSH
jgi:hypothetical protein